MFRRSGLQVAAAKTEVILLTGQRGNKVLPFEVLGSRVMSAEVIKYLGIMLDCRRSFKVHLREAAVRGDRIMGALASLLPNIGGPSVLARAPILFCLGVRRVIRGPGVGHGPRIRGY